MMVLFLYLMGDVNVKAELPHAVKTGIPGVVLAVVYFILFNNPNKLFIDFLFASVYFVFGGSQG